MTTLHKSAQDDLRRLVEQIERLENEKKDIADDIRDKFQEAQSTGFDTKILRKLLAMRKKTKVERDEDEAILHVYMHALGMLGDEGLPLARWADAKEGSAVQ